MANYNKVLLMGNLTRDPELKYTGGGQALAEFGLAVNRQWRTPAGEQQEETTFVDITVWGRQAETVTEYLSKGRPVFVEGRLQYDTWEGQDGQKRSKLRVVAERVQFLGSRPDSGGGGGGGQYGSSSRGAGAQRGGGQKAGGQPGGQRGPSQRPPQQEPQVQDGPRDEDLNLDDIPF